MKEKTLPELNQELEDEVIEDEVHGSDTSRRMRIYMVILWSVAWVFYFGILLFGTPNVPTANFFLYALMMFFVGSVMVHYTLYYVFDKNLFKWVCRVLCQIANLGKNSMGFL